MKKIIFLLFTTSIFLIGCTNNKFYTLKLKPIKTFYLVVPDSIISKPKCGLALRIDKKRGDTSLILAVDKYIIKGKINDTAHIIDKFISHVRFLNKCIITDSSVIFLKLDSLYFNFYNHKRKLFILPIKYTNIKKIFDDFLLWGKGCIKGDTLIFEKKFMNPRKGEVLFIYNYVLDKILDSLPVKFSTQNWQLKILFYQLVNKKMYFTNRYSDTIWVYTFKSKLIKNFLANSNLINRVPKKNFDEFNSPRYCELIYDRNNNVLWRRYIFKEVPGITNWKEGVVLVKNDKKIGEYLAPDTIKLTPYFFISSDKILLFKRIKNDKLFFTIYHYSYKPINYSKWLSSVTNLKHFNLKQNCPINLDTNLNSQQIKLYFNSLNLKVLDGLFILLPVRYSCPECIQLAVEFIKANAKFLSKKDVKVILIGKEKIGLSDFGSDNFVIKDTSEVFYKYFSLSTYNPMIIIFSNNKLIFYKVYEPKSMEKFQLDIIHYLGAKAEKKKKLSGRDKI